MISRKNIAALKTLYNKLSGVDWRLVGSTNLALQGVDIEVNDIDVRIRVEDIQTVQSALQSYCKKRIEYSQKGGFTSFYGQFRIEGVQVDVMAGGVEKKGFRTTGDVLAVKSIVIAVDGIEIPCVDLKTEYDAYISLGRKEKAELIKLAIDNNKE